MCSARIASQGVNIPFIKPMKDVYAQNGDAADLTFGRIVNSGIVKVKIEE